MRKFETANHQAIFPLSIRCHLLLSLDNSLVTPIRERGSWDAGLDTAERRLLSLSLTLALIFRFSPLCQFFLRSYDLKIRLSDNSSTHKQCRSRAGATPLARKLSKLSSREDPVQVFQIDL